MADGEKPTPVAGPVSKTRIIGAAVIAAIGIGGNVAKNFSEIANAMSPSSLRAVTVSPFAWFLDYGFWVLLWLIVAAAVIYVFWASVVNRLAAHGLKLEAKIDAIARTQEDMKGQIAVLMQHRTDMTNYGNVLLSRIDELSVRLLKFEIGAATKDRGGE